MQHTIERPSEWKNEYLICLYADLEKWKRKLDFRGISYTEFREPDLDNKLTAIATVSDGKLFKDLRLIK